MYYYYYYYSTNRSKTDITHFSYAMSVAFIREMKLYHVTYGREDRNVRK